MLILSLLVAPLATTAQQPAKGPRIGILRSGVGDIPSLTTGCRCDPFP
jgi:hypothetical protein